ncbi:MAG TPA: DUF2069 domain-containing protein [Pseudomonadales bacterium]|nr:DUF2069 domain-containing protein [Pseudomonadales bacterium]
MTDPAPLQDEADGGTARPDALGPGPAERLWHFLTIFAVGSLFAVYGLQRLFVDADGASVGAIVLLALQTGPLLACLPALIGGSARAAVALAFMSMIYLCVAVVTMVAPATRLAGTAELLFSMVLFLAATLFARQRGLRLQATGR